MTECGNDPRVRAWRAFQLAQVTAVERIEAELDHQGLPAHLAWYDVLYALSAAPDRALRMRELAPRVVITRSWLSRVVDRLEAEGLVCRRSCPSDRRGAFVVLTDEGAALLDRARPAYEAALDAHFARHVPDLDALRSAMEAITAPAAERV
ncbi:MAG: MarR family transcriptional regulator [Thermoleophilia bacterium]